MASPRQSLVFDRCLGAIETLSPWAIPPGYAQSAVNVELSPHTLMRPRCGTTAFGAGATADIYNMFTERINSAEALWSFSDWLVGTPTAHRYTTSGGAVAVTLTDTPAYSGDQTQPQIVCAAYNGKVFLAYNSSVNRLHVWDGTSVRRVGIAASAAATVANTGAGAYPATIRYYKIRFSILVSGVATVTSELSPVVSFTPSGAGTAARVTKPTTPDGATHWSVFGSADGVTFYNIVGLLAVGTTTYDDATNPVAYSGGEIAEEVGLYVPPPSCKYLATNGERLFMAGAYETTAASGQTTPTPRRVWFTRPLGVTDQGDDEAVTQTAASRYWIDIDNEDGSPITGLLSTLDGAVYAATSTSLWRLYDTGQADAPINAERVVAGVGPTSHYLMTATDTIDGAMVYFGANDGPYRYSPVSGVQYLGADWVSQVAEVGAVSAPRLQCCQFDPATRLIYWLYADGDTNTNSAARVFDPSLARNVEGVVRGGWSLNDYEYGGRRVFCLTVFERRLHFGGMASGSVGLLFYHDLDGATDDGTAYTATLTTPDVLFGDGTINVRTDDPYIWKRRDLSVALTLNRDRAGTGNVVTDTAASEAIGGSETSWHRQKVENCVVADAGSLSIALSITTPIITATSRHTDGVDRLVVPYIPQERA